MSKSIIKRIVITIVCVLIIPTGFYLVLMGFHNARYYQRYIEAPSLAWNQMKTVELAGLRSNAANESNLNAKVMDWSVNGDNVNWLIRLFRFRELAAYEKENKVFLCDLQAYRKKHPITDGYYDVIFSDTDKKDQSTQIKNLKANYIKMLTKDWQKILNLPCGGAS